MDVNGFLKVEGPSKVDGRVLDACQAVNPTIWSKTKDAHGFEHGAILHDVFEKGDSLAQDYMFDVS